MTLLFDLEKYSKFVQQQIVDAKSIEDINQVMEESKKFLQILFVFKEDE